MFPPPLHPVKPIPVVTHVQFMHAGLSVQACVTPGAQSAEVVQVFNSGHDAAPAASDGIASDVTSGAEAAIVAPARTNPRRDMPPVGGLSRLQRSNSTSASQTSSPVTGAARRSEANAASSARDLRPSEPLYFSNYKKKSGD